MSRFSVAVGVVFIALAAAGVAVWQTQDPSTHANVAGTSARPDPQHAAATISASSAAETRQAARDTAGPGQGSSENDRPHEPESAPSPDNDFELKAAFEELLADPDPEIRHEAERLAREFEVLAGQ